MLKETYRANLKNILKDSIIVEVTRVRGHILSPSWKLLNDYEGKKITWDEFVVRFKNEMNNNSCKSEMKKIKEASKSRDIYLTCYEKKYPCHRFILMELINGIDE